MTNPRGLYVALLLLSTIGIAVVLFMPTSGGGDAPVKRLMSDVRVGMSVEEVKEIAGQEPLGSENPDSSTQIVLYHSERDGTVTITFVDGKCSSMAYRSQENDRYRTILGN